MLFFDTIGFLMSQGGENMSEGDTEFKYKSRDLRVGMIVRTSELSEIKDVKIVLDNINKTKNHTYGEIIYIGKDISESLLSDDKILVM